MKKLMVASLCCVFGMGVSNVLADTLSKIAASGTITLAYRESSVPFSYLDGVQQPVGFTVDLSRLITEKVKQRLNRPNLHVVWQQVTSQNRIPLLQNGTIDLECGSTTNNRERGKSVDFATNHFYTGTRLLVKADSGISNYADLRDKTVVITTGTTNYQVLRKYNRDHQLNMKLITARDHADAFLLVQDGRADAFAMDDVLLFALKANARDPKAYTVVGDTLQVEPYACMVQKDDARFKKLVSETINEAMDSGEFSKLYNKWFLEPIPPKKIAIEMPMSQELQNNIKQKSDQPAS